MPHCS